MITKRLKLMLKSLLSFQMGEVASDNGTLIFDGEELKEGLEVFVKDENDELVPAADGEYKTEDGKIIVVENGLVASITDPEAEVASDEEIEESKEEVKEEEEVVVVDEPETEEVSVEDRVAALETKLDEILGGLNEIVNSIAALEGRIEEVEGKLAKVEAPAAAPIDENPDVQQSEHKESILSYLRK